MWKKIHSNRDPRDTLYSEIRKEFSRYFLLTGKTFVRLTTAHPKFLFGCMVSVMGLSLALSFTLFRNPGGTSVPVTLAADPVRQGFTQIMQVTGGIRETLRLKQLVDSLAAKDHLSGSDSSVLDSALNRLSRIHQTLK